MHLPTRFLACNQTQFSRTEGRAFLPSGPRNLVSVEASVNDSFEIFFGFVGLWTWALLVARLGSLAPPRLVAVSEGRINGSRRRCGQGIISLERRFLWDPTGRPNTAAGLAIARDLASTWLDSRYLAELSPGCSDVSSNTAGRLVNDFRKDLGLWEGEISAPARHREVGEPCRFFGAQARPGGALASLLRRNDR